MHTARRHARGVQVAAHTAGTNCSSNLSYCRTDGREARRRWAGRGRPQVCSCHTKQNPGKSTDGTSLMVKILFDRQQSRLGARPAACQRADGQSVLNLHAIGSAGTQEAAVETQQGHWSGTLLGVGPSDAGRIGESGVAHAASLPRTGRLSRRPSSLPATRA